MISNFLKTALRNLWKNKTYSFLNIFGLAVGIACAGLIFLWIEDETSYNHHNEKRDYLYQVLENQAYDGKTYTFSATPGVLAPGIKEEIPGIKNTARLTWEQYTLFSIGDKSIYERGFFADSNLLSMFSIKLLRGNKQTIFEQLKSVIISEKMAGRFFGKDVDIIGRSIRVDNKDDYIVTGVFGDIPPNSSLKFDWLAPFQGFFNNNPWLNEWGTNAIQTFVELDPSTDPTVVNNKLHGYIHSKDTSAIARPFLFAMNDWRLRSKFEEGKQAGGRIQYIRTFAIIAWIILLIACINFMNLSTARSEKRGREVGVRKVLGAARKNLITQFISEAFVMSFLSVLLAILIMQLVLPSFNLLVEKKLTIGLNIPSHVYALLLIGIVCGLIAGSYPAFYLSSFNPIWVFKGINTRGSGAAVIRKGLVVLQFTISIVLIISTIIIYRQVNHVKNRDLGYNKENVIQTGLRGNMQTKFGVMKEQFLNTGMVENAALSTLNMLYMGNSTSDFTWEGKDESKDVLITQDWVTPEYIKTFGMQIISGRDFYSNAKQDSGSVIINETLAKIIGKKEIVGSILRKDSVQYTIIGVVKNIVYDDMYGKSDPILFMCYPDNFGYMYVRLKENADPEKAVARIESIVKSNNPGYPFNYIFVDDEFERQFKSEMLIGKLSRIFAILAIIITCLGLFGLAAYTAERRTKEIGIRKVLGATVTGITSLLSKDFLKLVIVSAVIAFPVSWWAMNNWLNNYAYRTTISWWIFIIAGVLALLIAILTISFQSIRAAIANPVKSLRTE